jgi:hypothetical protein
MHPISQPPNSAATKISPMNHTLDVTGTEKRGSKSVKRNTHLLQENCLLHMPVIVCGI